ncbi:MAG TPA: heterodisulfide reductase-related iron-sulfur binding cluster [Gammaproteobacteria bacterium]|nr:heterodisulfide reductase-related iron-sulfur binding cluster [Gammaproteobacteria bacterium]
MTGEGSREGSLSAPIRHTVPWKTPEFYNEPALVKELERVYDICHGCRRCVSLCQAFPTLFDLVDNSSTMEVDGVAKSDYGKVVEHCYLCDLCYMTKCPYVPPHEWNVDFPQLMLRAKAQNFKKGKSRFRDRLLTSTDLVGNLAGIPVVAEIVNAANRAKPVRKLLDKALGIHPDASIPKYHSKSARKRWRQGPPIQAGPAGQTRGKVAVFVTCYGNRNLPQMVEDMTTVFRHNDLTVDLVPQEKCCGMPKLELGDLETVEQLKNANIPVLARMVEQGCDIIAPVPSCVLMFKKELPLLFPDEPAVRKVSEAMYDPFEYLVLRHKAGKFKTGFKQSLGKVVYHVPCHQRVQNIGLKTRDVLKLVPGTEIEVVERCSGHDGTYAVKSECHEYAVKICRPIVGKVQQSECDHYFSDCPMAGVQIESGLKNGKSAETPFALLRLAYGI